MHVFCLSNSFNEAEAFWRNNAPFNGIPFKQNLSDDEHGYILDRVYSAGFNCHSVVSHISRMHLSLFNRVLGVSTKFSRFPPQYQCSDTPKPLTLYAYCPTSIAHGMNQATLQEYAKVRGVPGCDIWILCSALTESILFGKDVIDSV